MVLLDAHVKPFVAVVRAGSWRTAIHHRERCIQMTFRTIVLSITLLTATLSTNCFTVAAPLPPIADRAPVPAPHFPDALHAVVWRNWGLVEPARLGEVLGATADQITEIATSMGLPAQAPVPAEMSSRGYITLIRRNWHLLPYEQLLQLLGISAEELAFRLREDDFLYIKLGSLKPTCPPVKYSPPNAAAKARAQAIRNIVEERFGARLAQPQEPRFAFIEEFSPQAAEGSESSAARAASDDEQLRFIFSYCAIFGDALSDPTLDPYPDELLAELRARGVNGVWLHTVLRQLAPGGDAFPEFGEGSAARLEVLRQLVERAGRHGIKIYLYFNEPRAMPLEFFDDRKEMLGVREGDHGALCTSHPAVRQWLTDAVAHVFHEVPGLGGVFTITASENLTNCSSHGQHATCPRCKDRTEADIVGELHEAIVAGVEREAPDAKVIAYDWGWGADSANVIKQLPDSVWLMSVSEWALPVQRGGVDSVVGEYSISAVGPGPKALRHWEIAQQRGLKTVAKVQLNNSWELSSLPYLPVLELVGQHCLNLKKSGVDGLMLSWSLGGYPSLNLELASLLGEMIEPDLDAALQRLAEKHYGPDAAPHVRRAWKQFSEAFQEYPFHISVLYTAPQQMGPANLLYGEPTGYQATMVGIPYDDLASWGGPFPPQTLAAQMEAVAEGWLKGIAELESALPLVPASGRPQIESDLCVAKAAYQHFHSVANQVRFTMARNARLSASTDADKNAATREQLTAIDQEIAAASRLFDLAVADSRLGYEPSNHYFYVPLDLVEKVVSCEHLRSQLQPAAVETP